MDKNKKFIVSINSFVRALSFFPPQINGDVSIISNLALLTGFLDENYYLKFNEDVAKSGIPASLHYVKYGYKEGRLPNPACIAYGWNVPFTGFNAESPSFIEFLNQRIAIIDGMLAVNHAPDKVILRSGSYSALTGMPLYINWMITDMCNYHCSYCFGQTKIDKSKFLPFFKYVNAVDNLASLNRDAYHFVFGCGEPTIYPHFIDLLHLIVSKLSKRVRELFIITNGSREREFYSLLYEIATLTPLTLHISLHTDHLSQDHIYKIIETVSDRIRLQFNLMFNPAKFNLVKEIHANLCNLRKEYPFNAGVGSLREPPKFDILDKRYTQEHFDWQDSANKRFGDIANKSCMKLKCFHPHSSNIFWDIMKDGAVKHQAGGDRTGNFRNGLYHFNNMYCLTGAHMARISSAGFLSGAVCQYAKRLFNIYEPKQFKDSDFIQVVKCGDRNCGCPANDPLLKFRDKNEADSIAATIRERQNMLFSS